MDAVLERCCGLDVHKKTVVACLLGPEGQSIETFGTTTRELLKLADWLQESGCTHVAMESTGSYWKPVYNLLEGRFTLLVVNARHLRAVPGRKSDMRDAQWIADLLKHGLLKPSFVPSRQERELRELTRYRSTLVAERSAEVNRIQKVLEGANIKLSSVASNVVGVSGRAMLESLVAGIEDPAALARLARGRLRSKEEALQEALLGLVHAHQRFLLGQQLRHIDELDRHIEEVSAEIEGRLVPFAEALEQLETIPGVGHRTAEVILAEVGQSIDRFPSAGHLASWAGLCPGMEESAGKNRSGRTPKGNQSLRTALVQAAHAAARTPTYLGAQYRKLRARIGPKKAAVAVAHSILVIAYHMLQRRSPFHDLGAAYFEVRDRDRAAKRLTKRLEQLGFSVTINAAA